MQYNLAKLIPVCPELEKIAPNNINHPLLLEVVDQITHEAESVLPPKRSGFFLDAMMYTNIYCQISHLSPKNATKDLRQLWKGHEHHFQRFSKRNFSNGKKRQALPDQPAISRFLHRISECGLSEAFGNLLIWAQFLYMVKERKIGDDIILIADYHDEHCHKDKADPYCFGTKEGKSVHRTLAFSVISGSLHLIIATFKIKKTQHKLPLFEEIIRKIQELGINIKYSLLDRGFYRKEILSAMKDWHITTILPGRTCADTKQKIKLWIQDQCGRTGKLSLKLKYMKKMGWQNLMMDYVLVGKRGHRLSKVKHDFKQGNITEADVIKRVFPLLVIKGNSKGLKMVRGNEDYIRSLYRKRWEIEIAFRQTHLIGIGNWYQNRDKRLFNFNLKCFIYNLWQIERERLDQNKPKCDPLTIDEFCGKMIQNRTICST